MNKKVDSKSVQQSNSSNILPKTAPLISKAKPTYLLAAALEPSMDYPMEIFDWTQNCKGIPYQLHHPLLFSYREGGHVSQGNSFALSLNFHNVYTRFKKVAELKNFWSRIKEYIFLRRLDMTDIFDENLRLSLMNQLLYLRYLDDFKVKCSSISELVLSRRGLQYLVNLHSLSLKLKLDSSEEQMKFEKEIHNDNAMCRVFSRLKKLKLSLKFKTPANITYISGIRHWLSDSKQIKNLKLSLPLQGKPEEMLQEMKLMLAKRTKLITLNLKLKVALKEVGKAFSDMVESILHMPSLMNLTLNFINVKYLGTLELKSLAKIFEKNKNLKKIMLILNLDPDSLRNFPVLAPAFKNMNHLEDFGLDITTESKNSIQGYEKIFEFLPNTIKKITLKICKIGNEETQLTKIMQQIKLFAKLERLELGFERIGFSDEVLIRLGDSLVGNTKIKELSFNIEKIKGKINFGFMELIKAIVNIKQLKSLKFHFEDDAEHISSEGYSKLASTIGRLMELEELVLEIFDTEFCSNVNFLAENLKNKKKLKYLKVSLRFWTTETYFYLVKCLQGSKSLETLNIDETWTNKYLVNKDELTIMLKRIQSLRRFEYDSLVN